MKIKIGILHTVALVGCLASSFGQTVTWTGTTGNWGTATNWSSGTVPSSSQSVLWSDAGTSGSPSLGGNRTIGEFIMTRTSNVIVTMNPDNLTITGTAGNTGNLTTQAGAGSLTFRNAGVLTVQGNMTVASQMLFGTRGGTGSNSEIGGVSVAGTTTVSSTLEFVNFSSGGTVNLGSLAMSSGGVLNLTAGSGANGTTSGTTNLVTVNRLNGATGTIQANKAGTTGHLSVSGTVSGSYGGTILNSSGTVQLTKSGSSTLTLTGSNSYTGATAVNAGTLLIAGSLGNTAVAVGSTGILGGSGTIGGAVTVNSGGRLSPGTSPGRLTVTNSVTIADGGAAAFEINGATVATDYDQVRMTGGGSVFSLTGTNNLVLSLGYSPVANTLYFLVDNQGISGISGIFEQLNGVTTNLAQGAIFTVGAQQFQISYVADVGSAAMTGGNDLALQAVPEPGAVTLLVGGLTMLMIMRRRSKR